MTKIAEFIELESTELVTKLADARRELFNLRFQLATGQLDNTARMREVKRDVARILTTLRAREIEVAEALAASEGGAQ